MGQVARQRKESALADEPTQEPTDDKSEDQPEAPKPKVEYLGKEWDPEELVDELRKKDAHITRQSQELAASRKVEEPEEPQTDDDFAQQVQLRAARKQLGLPEEGSLDEYLDKKLAQREQTAKVTSQLDTLKNKYSGEGENKDYPKFDPDAVLQYAQSKNIYDLEVAYREMNYGKILDAEVKKAQAKSTAPKGDTSDAPRVEATDKETLKKMVEEAGGDPTKLANVLVKTGQGLRNKTPE